MTGNYFDYKHLSTNIRNSNPSFVNVIKPKKLITNSFFSKSTIGNINNAIDNIQKILRVYDQAVPLIKQTGPLLGNIKTTFKVAKAFKSFSNDSSLEKAFDNLPDFEENKEVNSVLKEDKGGTPFYPKS